MSWYLMALRKYATFSGSAQRKEFRFFLAPCLLLLILLLGVRLAFADRN